LSWYQRNTSVSDFWTIHKSNQVEDPPLVSRRETLDPGPKVEVAVAERPYLCRTVRLQRHELPFLEITARLHPSEAAKTALVVRDLRVVVEMCSAWVEEELAGLHPLQMVKKALVVRDLPVVVEGCSAWAEVEVELLQAVKKACVVRDL
jgi:hypothetical protein